MQVNMHAAKTKLSQLVEAAERGEEVLLARDGRPVAKIVSLAPERKFFSLEGVVPTPEDDLLFEAITEKELDEMLGLRDE